MRRIHIVGVSPRSGTTLLAECMRSCFRIDCTEDHEAPVTRLRRSGDIYLTKRPEDLSAVRPRLLIDRYFYAICMVRDPRDVIASRHGKDLNRYWVPLRMWKETLPAFRRLARHPRFIAIRYEDLVTRPDETQRELCRRLAFLRTTGRFSSFASIASPSHDSLNALRGLRAIETASIGSWRDHLPRLAGQLAIHGPITDELIEFGYEQDATWLSLLAGVTPDFTPSHISERRRRTWKQFNQDLQGLQASVATAVLLAGRACGLKMV